jgi:Pre-toxin TG
MSITRQAIQYGQRRIARKMLRSVPWLGSIVAIATLGAAVRRKGFFGGTIDTALDFIPFVGGMKNAAEIARGRDLIRDRPVR